MSHLFSTAKLQQRNELEGLFIGIRKGEEDYLDWHTKKRLLNKECPTLVNSLPVNTVVSFSHRGDYLLGWGSSWLTLDTT